MPKRPSLLSLWVIPVLLVATAMWVAFSSPLTPVTVVVIVIELVLAWVFSPLLFPRSEKDNDGRRLAAERGVPLVYWRPGCTYCMRLRIALNIRSRRAVWVNVSGDESASLRVRSANDGNETVPTVFVGDASYTNPSAAWMRKQLSHQ